MTAPLDLDAFLRTDPRDVGCGEAMDLLHAYADRYLTAPDEAARRYPGILIHLRACGPCATDFEGLLTLLEAEARPR